MSKNYSNTEFAKIAVPRGERKRTKINEVFHSCSFSFDLWKYFIFFAYRSSAVIHFDWKLSQNINYDIWLFQILLKFLKVKEEFGKNSSFAFTNFSLVCFRVFKFHFLNLFLFRYIGNLMSVRTFLKNNNLKLLESWVKVLLKSGYFIKVFHKVFYKEFHIYSKI